MEYEKLKSHLRTMYVIVNTNEKFLYTVIPKSGCTSILNSIMPTFGININTNTIHKELQELSDKDYINGDLVFLNKSNDYKEIIKALFSKNYYRFTCLRDPKSRLISAFFNKILYPRTDMPFLPFCLPFIKQKEKNIEKSFDDLLNCIASLEDSQIDSHFRSQVSLSLANIIPYNKIFMLDSLINEYEILTKKFTRIQPIGRLNWSKNDKELKKYLGDKYQDQIYEIYKKDYEFLYSKQLLS